MDKGDWQATVHGVKELQLNWVTNNDISELILILYLSVLMVIKNTVFLSSYTNQKTTLINNNIKSFHLEINKKLLSN